MFGIQYSTSILHDKFFKDYIYKVLMYFSKTKQ